MAVEAVDSDVAVWLHTNALAGSRERFEFALVHLIHQLESDDTWFKLFLVFIYFLCAKSATPW